MAAFGALVGWHDQPLLAAGITNRLEPKTFPVLSLAAAGWTLAGFALGVLAGILWRRVIPALATAFAAWFGLAYLGSLFRTHYQAPLTTTRLQIPLHDLVTAQWWTKSGARVPDAQINRVLQAIGLTAQGTGSSIAHPGDGNVDRSAT